MSDCTPLESALATVPDEIKTVRDWDGARLTAEAERCADLISQSSIMMWWSETARKRQKKWAGQPVDGRAVADSIEPDPDVVGDAVARGLAILAIRPAGVEFAGLHLCDHPGSHNCNRGALAIDPTPKPDAIKVTGAYWTPRTLAEEVTDGTLEAVVYDPGPLQTADESAWRLRPATEILSKTVADIAVGAGVFPMAALRYLTARILDHADPGNITSALEQHVRAQVITNCLYGADINPASLELCRIAMALMVPLVDIDAEIRRRFRCGDSLLGIAGIDDLRFMDLNVKRGRTYHNNVPVIDVNAVAAAHGDQTLWLLADLATGAALATAAKGVRAWRQMAGEVEDLARRVAAGESGAVEKVRARALELLDTDRPAGCPPRNPLHWPLAFPEVFGATPMPSFDPEEF